MNIAILGTRGIPNRYGGFEAFAEKLSQRLVSHGHQVTVYCRRPFTRPGDEKLLDPRIRRVILPTISSKHLDTAAHTLLSVAHVVFTSADVVLICNVANAPLAWIPRLFATPVVLNVDGLDRRRRKWGWLARAFIRLCEITSAFTPSRVVTDSLANQEYYRRRYSKNTTMIGYGAEPPQSQRVFAESQLERLGLTPRQYVLYVSRLEPENNPELVLRAYERVNARWPLVMVGSSTYEPAYEQSLKSLAGRRVIFTGAIYGDGYWELQQNAGVFIFACEIGGIHPALIEAMAVGNAVLYLDTPSNRETAADSGLVFSTDPEDLAAKLSHLLANPPLQDELRRNAAARARALYSWDEVTRKYEELFTELTKSSIRADKV
jgi:glycosyltransferase involved in cell wall biosynthesis